MGASGASLSGQSTTSTIRLRIFVYTLHRPRTTDLLFIQLWVVPPDTITEWLAPTASQILGNTFDLFNSFLQLEDSIVLQFLLQRGHTPGERMIEGSQDVEQSQVCGGRFIAEKIARIASFRVALQHRNEVLEELGNSCDILTYHNRLSDLPS